MKPEEKEEYLKRYIEKLVTVARDADLNTHRYVFAALHKPIAAISYHSSTSK